MKKQNTETKKKKKKKQAKKEKEGEELLQLHFIRIVDFFPLCLPVSFASSSQPSSNTIFKHHQRLIQRIAILLSPCTAVFKKNRAIHQLFRGKRRSRLLNK